jgi:SNF2 family DNA or RNA helicase
MTSLDDIDRQITELQALREAKLKEQAKEVLVSAVVSANLKQTSIIKLSHMNHEELNELLKSFAWDSFYGGRQVPFKLFDGLVTSISNLQHVKLDPSIERVKEQAALILATPDVVVDYKEPNLTIKFSGYANLNRYRFFSYQLESVVREDYHRKLFTLPVSLGSELIEIVENQRKNGITVEITELAKQTIEEEVRKLALIDTIATLEYYKEGDIKLADAELKLRPFQTVTMKFAELSNDRFLIGDEMGLGKTWQMVARAMMIGTRTLFIVPPSLIPNWVREIVRLTGKEPLVFRGREPNQIDIMELVVHKSHQFNLIGWTSLSTVFEKEEEGATDTVSVAPWVNYINLSEFGLICLDEVHRGKNENSSRSKAMLQLKCERIIGASGTPVVNRPAEYFNFLHLIAPSIFTSRTDYESRYTNGRNGARNVEELQKLLRPLMIRRKKADVIKDLPPIERISDFVELSAEDRKTYDVWLLNIKKQIDGYGHQWTKETNNILAEILRAKQFLADCASNRSVELALELYENAVENEHPHKKVIIFSQFRDTAKKIMRLLGHEALWFDGTVDVEERMKVVDAFIAEDKYKFLCVTTKAAGEGLNITAAGSVIFNDLMWTPADHSQAEARAYGRLNDAHGVDSYYIMVTDSIMSWIWEMLEAKMRVIEQVVDGVQTSRAGESVATAIIKRIKEL